MASAKQQHPVIMLAGAGSMGGALLRGWIDAGAISPKSIIIDPAISEDIKHRCDGYGLAVYDNIGDVATTEPVDLIIFAVKPQIAASVLPNYAFFAKTAVSVSIMAGKSIAAMGEMLGGPEKLVRVMPNLPASIGQGMSGAYATDSVSLSERAHVEALLKAAGKTVWVQTEEGIDFVTAISGSGPAYYFLLTEALTQAGVMLGINSETAQTLARQTAIGSGALMAQDERSSADLRIAITSPGGTTEAALAILDDQETGFRPLMQQAAIAAAKRAKDLSG